MNPFRLYGELSKVEDQDDGTIIVIGTASSGARDEAGEIITPDAMKAALPDYLKWGAIREMHQPSAAGTALGAEVQDDGKTVIETHIVDPDAVKKVKARVYKGFSVGGKVLARDPQDRSIITKIRLSEISLVDRPCNPEAAIDLWRADGIEPKDTDMTDQAALAPSNDAVRARAEEMAKAAGKPAARYADYVVKAREALIEEAAAEAEQGGAEAAAAGDEPVVEKAEAGGAEAHKASFEAEIKAQMPDIAPVDLDVVLERCLVPGDVALEGPEAMAKFVADAMASVFAAAEPDTSLAAAMREALEKAKATPVAAPGPFDDLAKAGKALLAMNAAVSATDPLFKSLYDVAWLAELMARFADLQSWMSDEARWERDGSGLPAQAAAIVEAIAALLVAAATEEAAEAVDSMNGAALVVVDDDELVVELASSIADLVKADTALMEKAGKRNSKKDAETIQKMHDHATDLGAMCKADNCAEKAQMAEDLAKAQAKVERLEADRAASAEMLPQLTKAYDDRIAALEKAVGALPLPGKTAGSSIAVDKAQDSAGHGAAEAPELPAEAVKKYLDGLSPEERGMALMKATLSRPIPLSHRA